MPKSTVINIERPYEIQKVAFKQLSLLFDHIYVDNKDLNMGLWDIEKSKNMSIEQKRTLISEVDWMIQQGILKTYLIPRGSHFTITDPFLLKDIDKLAETIESKVIPLSESELNESKSDGFRLAGVVELDNQTIFNAEDIRMRVGAAYLGTQDPLTEFVPILNSFESYIKTSSRDLAAHVVLGNIPVPDSLISWEQLIDFRNNEEIKRKYYALLNWINDMAKADLPLHLLVDKYNQLHSEYLHQYQLHKINSKLTKVEILFSCVAEVINLIATKGVFSAFKGMISVSQKQVSLLQSEKNIQGKELSYLFSVNEKFGLR